MSQNEDGSTRSIDDDDDDDGGGGNSVFLQFLP